MTPHAHPRFVSGCYRCQISRDELLNDQVPRGRCSTCGGEGRVFLPAHPVPDLPCLACDGTGETNGSPSEPSR